MELASCDDKLKPGEAVVAIGTNVIIDALRQRINLANQLEAADRNASAGRQTEKGWIKGTEIDVAEVTEHESEVPKDEILCISVLTIVKVL
jgi:hypothetical protein